MAGDVYREQYKRADQLFKEGKYAESLQILDQLDQAVPNNKNISYARAMSLAKLNRRDEALAVCEFLIKNFGDPKAVKLQQSLQSQQRAAPTQPLPQRGPAAPMADDTSLASLSGSIRAAIPGNVGGLVNCTNHLNVPAAARCSGCAEPFCENCLVDIQGERYCASCKTLGLANPTSVTAYPAGGLGGGYVGGGGTCTEARDALIYGILGLFCCGPIFGTLAIVKANQARRIMASDPSLSGSGMATFGLVLGIIDIVAVCFWVAVSASQQ